jgi:hypothetical protein
LSATVSISQTVPRAEAHRPTELAVALDASRGHAPRRGVLSLATMNDTELGLIDAYWRAANYLSIGQI